MFQSRLSRVFKKNSIFLYAGFFIFTIIILTPVYWMARSSIANAADLYKTPLIYFPSPSLANFNMLMTQVPLFQYVRNSLIFALATTTATLLVSFMAAYAFARIKFPGSGILMWVLVLSTALPDIGTIVPLYQLLKNLHLLDTIAGITLILCSALAPFTVWALISFIKQIPYEIEEAAIIDGASLPRIIWHILLPVTLPGLVTMGLINFINAWNNLLYPLSFTTSNTSKTLSVAITEIYNAYSPYGKPWELIMTVGVAMTIPIVILVLFSQRAIIRGLVSGAIK
ncbi:MAG: carbohydrate ABC transporter permease [Anaerolineaceae bacterium]|nr:carbohydrate ABC transporter permease [Anaerolineaceae bacterium]